MTEPRNSPDIGVVAILRRGDRYLLIQRGKAPNLGYWAFPGGSQQRGETIAAAALRELAEETGAMADSPELLAPIEAMGQRPDGEVTYHFVIVPVRLNWVSGEGIAGDDAADVGWFTPTEMGKLQILDSVLDLIARLESV